MRLLLLFAGLATAGDPALDEKLLTAAAQGRSAAVKVLLRNGADKNAATPTGATGLMLAARNGHEKVVEAYLDAEADAALTDDAGYTALLYAASRGRRLAYKVLRARGIRTAPAAGDGTTLLHAAAEGLPLEDLREVFKESSGLDATDAAGLSALDRAVAADRRENADFLARAAAGSGLAREAFVRAAGLGRAAIVADWLARGMSPDAENAEGLSAWRAAAKGAHWPVLEAMTDPAVLAWAREASMGPEISGMLARAAKRGDLGPAEREELELGRRARTIDVRAYAESLARWRAHKPAFRLAQAVAARSIDLDVYLAARAFRPEGEALRAAGWAVERKVDLQAFEAAVRKPVALERAFAAARLAYAQEIDSDAFARAARKDDLDEAVAAGRSRMQWRVKPNKTSDELRKEQAVFAALGTLPRREAEAFAEELLGRWTHDRSTFFSALDAGDSFLDARAAARASTERRLDGPTYLRLRREGLPAGAAFARAVSLKARR